MPDDAAKQKAYLVRELVANLKIRKAGKVQAAFRQRLCQSFYAGLADFESTHLLRAYEALCEADFPDPDMCALRDHVTRRLAEMGKLRNFRNVVIPGREKYLTRPACPHN